MSGVPSAKGDTVPPLGYLVSTRTLRPIYREPSLKRGVPFQGNSYFGGAVDPLCKPLFESEGGLAYTGLADVLRKLASAHGHLCEGEGNPSWWKGWARAPSSLPALGLCSAPGGPLHVALGTPQPGTLRVRWQGWASHP